MSRFKYTGPTVAVDAVVSLYSSAYHANFILAIERADGTTALPGGMVDDTDISLQHAVVREVREETNFLIGKGSLEPLSARTNKNRDKRGWIISHPFFYRVPLTEYSYDLPILRAGDDAKHAFWMDCRDMKRYDWYADHLEIIQEAVWAF